MIPLLDLLRRSYPDTNAPETTNPLELSKFSPFKDVHYTTEEKAEIQQWLTTAAHLPGGDSNSLNTAPATASAQSTPTPTPSSAQSNSNSNSNSNDKQKENNEDEAKTAARLSSLNTHLANHTTLLSAKPSIADIAVFARLAPIVRGWTAEQRTGAHGYHHIVRHLDYVQNAPVFGLRLAGEGERVAVDVGDVRSVIKPVDVKAEKERKKKEKAAAAAAIARGKEEGSGSGGVGRTDTATVVGTAAASTAGVADTGAAGTAGTSGTSGGAAAKKKENKKEKAPKPAKATPAAAAASEKPLSPGLIDLRVGHIVKAERHPNADSLYVSRIAVGDPAGTDNTEELDGAVVRTVCSGLNGKVPLEEMQGRRVVAVCNLKPVTMRGIKSAAMVLAASEAVGGDAGSAGGTEGAGGAGATEGTGAGGGSGATAKVELVDPPQGAEAGDRVFFEGWQAERPEAVLNPKKKVWEMCQVGFTTTGEKVVGFDPAKVPQLAVAGAGAGAEAEAEAGKGVALLKTKSGNCTVKSLIGAEVR